MLALAAAAVPALIAALVLGSTLVTAVGRAEKDFDTAMAAAQRLAEIRVLIEREHGIVTRIPAELNLDNVERYRQEIADIDIGIDANLAQLARNEQVVSRSTATEIAAIRGELSTITGRIVICARSFAQSTALALVHDYFEPANGALITMLDAVTSNVNSTSEKARGDLRRSSELAWVTTPLALVAALLAAGFGFWLVQRYFVDPVLRLTSHMIRIRQTGNPDPIGNADLARRNDEVGTLARAFDLTMEELAEARRELMARSEAEINTQYRRLEAAISNMPQGLSMFDAAQKLIVCNRRYAELYELGPELTVAGTDLARILDHRASLKLNEAPGFLRESAKALAEGGPWYYVQEMRDGQAIAISYRPMASGGFVATHEDITERRRAEARIAYMAHHDALTGLLNRVKFREELEGILGTIAPGERAAVLCVDLDRFKSVNDTLGHPAGDALLQAVADRLRGCLGPLDVVARVGGDEFALVQYGAQPVDATTLSTEIIKAVGQPYDIDGHQVIVSASVGIALAPDDGDDPDILLKKADIALYRAKKDGRNAYRFFESDMDATMQERRVLEMGLRQALELNQFEIFYQPLLDLKSGRVSGFEALLRWRHQARGLVSPADFIPLAEEIGLIVPIGRWVLQRACQDAMNWPGDIKLAVNLSPVQFKSGTLVFDVVSALARSGLPAHRLELEITESALLESTEATIAILDQLRELGARISMDDFGTGYSSLSYLRSFPFDKIKIDQSFIRELSDAPESIAIVRAIASLGSSLGMSVTAEGVETTDQLRRIHVEGCTEAQGYLFSRPRPAHEVEMVLRDLVSANGTTPATPAQQRSGRAGR
ncbi:EAL domain-containing protein [Bradyrhizobium sp. 199]|nr:EAL domain-containing protein [Bradyrhizobium sp. 199]